MERYTFAKTEDKELFNKFSEENGGSVYQTSYWAEVKSAWRPSFYMGFDGDKPVLSALCLERDVRVCNIWYCPDGFVCDLENKELVSAFSAFMLSEMKKNKIAALVCDPLIVERINGEERDFSAVSSLTESGFVINKERDFYIVQPPLTIQTTLKDKTPESLLKKCEKGVRHGLRSAEDGALYSEEYDDKTLPQHPEKLDEFFEVMTETSDRVSFIQRDKSYYEKIVTSLCGKAVMNLIYCDNLRRQKLTAEAEAKKAENEKLLSELETAEKKDKKQISALKKENESLETTISRNAKVSAELSEKFGENVPDKICLAVGITSRFGKTAICLYGGTRNLLRNTLRPTHFLNWTRILKSFDMGMEVHDLGRVTGDPNDENNPLYGLCRYKKSYDGEVTEFVGDLYLIADKFRFSLFRTLLPKVKKIKNTVFKKTIKTKTVKNSR